MRTKVIYTHVRNYVEDGTKRLQDIGDAIGVTKERSRQLKKEAFEQLKTLPTRM